MPPLERFCWDGDWYLRAFFDNGSPLGSHANAEARIDSLPQTWAVISGAGDSARSKQAMESARVHLVDENNRMVRLFTPPFDHSEPHPGYIMGYPPGVRENGGQYTHGSLWMAMAFARMGDGDAAVQTLKLMNPVENSRDTKAVERYRGEPYVVAADVSQRHRKSRASRVDVVHGVGGLDVSHLDRGSAWVQTSWRSAQRRAGHSGRLAGLRGHLSSSFVSLRDCRAPSLRSIGNRQRERRRA